MNQSEAKMTVVFIAGFLSPPQWISYPEDNIPEHINMIHVFPSQVGSLHDRACQIFFELVGGTVDYGEEHSLFHNHPQYETDRKSIGKLADWSESNPIILVGHSLGGNTAWVLQNYLENKIFKDYPNTSAKWIKGIITVNSPLNGALGVYSRGLDYTLPPIVKWGSSGFIVACLVHIQSYLNIKVIDWRQNQWKIEYYNGLKSLIALLNSFYGFCLHSNKDNISYDASIQSQILWNEYLNTYSNSFYISIVGKPKKSNRSTYLKLKEFIHNVTKTNNEPNYIAGIEISSWNSEGNDGLLSVYTQEYPKLSKYSNSTNHYNHLCFDNDIENINDSIELKRGVWNFTYRDITHVSASFKCEKTWKFIWDCCEMINNNTKTAFISTDNEYLSGNSNNKKNSIKIRPDMQKSDLKLENRYYYLSKLSHWSILILVVAINLFYFDYNSNIIGGFYKMLLIISYPLCYRLLLLNPSDVYSLTSDNIEIWFSLFQLLDYFINNNSNYNIYYLQIIVLGIVPHRIYNDTTTISRLLSGLMLSYHFNNSSNNNNSVESINNIILYLNILLVIPSFGWQILYLIKEKEKHQRNLIIITFWSLYLVMNISIIKCLMNSFSILLSILICLIYINRIGYLSDAYQFYSIKYRK